MLCKDLTVMTCLSKSCYLYGMQPRYAQLKKNLHRQSLTWSMSTFVIY